MPVYYCETEMGCALIYARTKKQAERQAREDVGNMFQFLRKATAEDIDWVIAMGGYRPTQPPVNEME